MSATEIPAELTPELARLGVRRIRAMQGRVGIAVNYGVPADEIMDWLIEGGCSVQLAEWMIDQARRTHSSRDPGIRRAILGDPVRVRTPIELIASALCASAWIFLVAVVANASTAFEPLLPVLGLALLVALVALLKNLFEIGQCIREWLDRRGADRSDSNS